MESSPSKRLFASPIAVRTPQPFFLEHSIGRSLDQRPLKIDLTYIGSKGYPMSIARSIFPRLDRSNHLPRLGQSNKIYYRESVGGKLWRQEKSSQNESVHFWRRFLIMIIGDRYIFWTIISSYWRGLCISISLTYHISEMTFSFFPRFIRA